MSSPTPRRLSSSCPAYPKIESLSNAQNTADQALYPLYINRISIIKPIPWHSALIISPRMMHSDLMEPLLSNKTCRESVRSDECIQTLDHHVANLQLLKIAASLLGFAAFRTSTCLSFEVWEVVTAFTRTASSSISESLLPHSSSDILLPCCSTSAGCSPPMSRFRWMIIASYRCAIPVTKLEREGTCGHVYTQIIHCHYSISWSIENLTLRSR